MTIERLPMYFTLSTNGWTVQVRVKWCVFGYLLLLLHLMLYSAQGLRIRRHCQIRPTGRMSSARSLATLTPFPADTYKLLITTLHLYILPISSPGFGAAHPRPHTTYYSYIEYPRGGLKIGQSARAFATTSRGGTEAGRAVVWAVRYD